MRTLEGEIQDTAPSTDRTPMPARVPLLSIEESALPCLQKSGGISNMKRTPQPTLTQSKLTSILQVQSRGGIVSGGSTESEPRTVSLEAVEMDTSAGPGTALTPAAPATGTVVTTDFLLKALKENTDHLIKSFKISLSALSQRVDANASNISANTTALSQHAAAADKQGTELRNLADRVTSLKKASNNTTTHLERRATLGPEYTRARRSIRLWPIPGICEDELWGGMGAFLHETLAISGDHLGQEDIERIDRATDGRDHVERKEVIVKFFDKQKRDLVVASSPALCTCFDKDGKPTAGIRLEVSP